MTVHQFLKELGGAAQVARDLGIPYTTVACWQQRNNVPHWRMADLTALAFRKGVPVPARFAEKAA